jgi:rSAM/selenodomain-associated transferase 1
LSNNLLILFVKHPIPGQVKTRLAAGIGHEKALAIYQALLQHTLTVSQQVEADTVVFYGNELPDTDLWAEAGLLRVAQRGEDLGERMAHAFRWGFQRGYKRLVLVGSDIAGLNAPDLNQAFVWLETVPAVFGPANDGGYYLVGLREMLPALFENKTWSTDSVLRDSLRDLRVAQFAFRLLPEVADIDTAEDLKGTWLEKYT